MNGAHTVRTKATRKYGIHLHDEHLRLIIEKGLVAGYGWTRIMRDIGKSGYAIGEPRFRRMFAEEQDRKVARDFVGMPPVVEDEPKATHPSYMDTPPNISALTKVISIFLMAV